MTWGDGKAACAQGWAAIEAACPSGQRKEVADVEIGGSDGSNADYGNEERRQVVSQRRHVAQCRSSLDKDVHHAGFQLPKAQDRAGPLPVAGNRARRTSTHSQYHEYNAEIHHRHPGTSQAIHNVILRTGPARAHAGRTAGTARTRQHSWWRARRSRSWWPCR